MIVLQFKSIADSFRFRRSEWGCAAGMAAWGWILVQPYPTFDNPSFVVMRHWAGEETWGWGALILGCASLFVMVYNGRFRHFPEARMVVAFLRCFVWASIVWGLIRGNMWSPGIAAYGAFLFMDAHTIYSASYDAARVREDRRGGGA